MRQYRSAAGAANPLKRLSQNRPDGRHIPDPSCAEIVAKGIISVASVLLFDEETGEMAPADSGGISGVQPCALQAARYTCGIELRGNAYRSLTAAAAD